MRTLIFGAKGQLGRDLAEVFAALGPVAEYDLPELDISEAGDVAEVTAGFCPDLILNAAAYTNVEAAESDEDAAFRVNAAGAEILAAAAHRTDVPIVYYSTDYVFDGRASEPYREDHPVAPLGVYACSKAAGEIAVRHTAPRHFILRTAWLYGPAGNCFPKKMLDWADTCPELKVVDDEVGSPTHTWDLAEATRALVTTSAFGTYHAVNAGQCSRYELACATLRLAGKNTPVRPCISAEFPAKAPRPLYSVLCTDKLRSATGFVFRDWRDALGHFMKRLNP